MYLLSKIKAIKETDKGTELIVEVSDFIKEKILRQKINKAELRFDDGRTISAEQRKKLYATIRDIALWQGDIPEYTKEVLKFMYAGETGEGYFSLSSCTMTTAKDFISYVLDFALENNIPLKDLGVNRTDDINRYLFSCIKFRTCAISGKPNAEIHHVEGSRVGMGRNRKEVDHSKLELIALSHEYHELVHQEGETDLFEKYKVFGIKVDTDTLYSLGLNFADIS